jgi:starvation-inducible outer membrane lipoprotein
MADSRRPSDADGTMKKNLFTALLATAIALQLLLAGCASTAEGIKQDYKKIEDKV